MKTLDELLRNDDPAWPLIDGWIATAPHQVERLPPSATDREQVLLQMQVSTRSTLGAVIYESGGLLIDHGWVRVLGCGHSRLPRTLSTWNEGRTRGANAPLSKCLLVADDVLGGFFALDGGAFGAGDGAVYYFAPDTLKREYVTDGYTSLLQLLIAGDLANFYGNDRWPDWEAEIERLAGDRGIHVSPPLWTKEGKDVARSSRRTVPVSELFRLNVVEYPAQLTGQSS